MIHYTVEEPQETEHSELTADHILEKARFAPKDHYLVEIRGKERISYQGRGHEEIHLHECQRFIAIHTGPTPVSDLPSAGPTRFVTELHAVGYSATADKEGRVTFNYEVEVGKYAGKRVTLGIIVNTDFPLNPPGGIHVSPHIHAMQSGGVHPTGGINASPFGAEFQYWSRPFHGWASTSRRTADYMAFVRQLWATQ